ncbi:hypothetical protein QTO34_010015 [Cnephaeus nilssonii]|uniref:Uncharacterized protein n=1 Tax=Cnephaeus nilssonii TaxID=3371016 RepID=A0AA40HFF8_CNENI|nr:hypothetical protein QTO34_010015 [Eptesicus nilssonii]
MSLSQICKFALHKRVQISGILRGRDHRTVGKAMPPSCCCHCWQRKPRTALVPEPQAALGSQHPRFSCALGRPWATGAVGTGGQQRQVRRMGGPSSVMHLPPQGAEGTGHCVHVSVGTTIFDPPACQSGCPQLPPADNLVATKCPPYPGLDTPYCPPAILVTLTLHPPPPASLVATHNGTYPGPPRVQGNAIISQLQWFLQGNLLSERDLQNGLNEETMPTIQEEQVLKKDMQNQQLKEARQALKGLSTLGVFLGYLSPNPFLESALRKCRIPDLEPRNYITQKALYGMPPG